jgi:hypothetical protein
VEGVDPASWDGYVAKIPCRMLEARRSKDEGIQLIFLGQPHFLTPISFLSVDRCLLISALSLLMILVHPFSEHSIRGLQEGGRV